MGQVFLIMRKNAVYNDFVDKLIAYPINCVILSDYAIANPTYTAFDHC